MSYLIEKKKKIKSKLYIFNNGVCFNITIHKLLCIYQMCSLQYPLAF